MIQLSRYCQTVLQRGCTSTSINSFFYFSHSGGMGRYRIIVLVGTSLTTNEVEQLCLFLISQLDILLYGVSVQIFYPFLILGFFWSFPYWFVRVLYIFILWVLCRIYVLQISFPTVACPFVLSLFVKFLLKNSWFTMLC